MRHSINLSDIARVFNNDNAPWRNFFNGAYYHFASLDSTQRYLRDHQPLSAPIFCRSDTQLQGEGQRGRQWQSSADALTFSLRLTLNHPVQTHFGLTQAIGLSIVTAIDPNADFLQLKWPNDLLHQQRKLGGILVESHAPVDDPETTTVIIGIGINISATDSAYAYCQDFAPDCDRDSVLQTIMPAIIACLERWQHSPYLPADHRWTDYDRYHNQNVKLDKLDGEHTILGIDHKGRLIARHNGQITYHLNTRIQAQG